MEKEYKKRIKYLSERSRFCLTSRIQLAQIRKELKTLGKSAADTGSELLIGILMGESVQPKWKERLLQVNNKS